MVTTEDVRYEADGVVMVGRLALPDGDEKRPGVLIAHEGGGLDDFQMGRAARLAELGFVAFALDYHGGGRPLVEEDDINSRCQELWKDPERIRAIADAGLAVLVEHSRTDSARVAAVGYCFGGAFVLELARSGAALTAVVGFHPRLATMRPEDAANIRAKVLVCVGTEDPLIPAPERRAFEHEMRASGVDWRMNLYGRAEHSFTNPSSDHAGRPGVRYDRLADERSWRAMLDLFDEVFD